MGIQQGVPQDTGNTEQVEYQMNYNDNIVAKQGTADGFQTTPGATFNSGFNTSPTPIQVIPQPMNVENIDVFQNSN